jgi:hypothetical protein
MSNDIKDIETINAFENESETINIDEFVIENRLDRVSIYGSIDITKDKIGLEKIRAIKKQIDKIADKLENEDLPDEIEILAAKTVENPFE